MLTFVDAKCDKLLDEPYIIDACNLMELKAFTWNKISFKVIFIV